MPNMSVCFQDMERLCILLQVTFFPPLLSWASVGKIPTVETAIRGKKKIFNQRADSAELPFHSTLAVIGKKNPHLHICFSPPATLQNLKLMTYKRPLSQLSFTRFRADLPNCPPTEKVPFRVAAMFFKAGSNHASVLTVLKCGATER